MFSELDNSILSEEFNTRVYMEDVAFQLKNENSFKYLYFENKKYYCIDSLIDSENEVS